LDAQKERLWSYGFIDGGGAEDIDFLFQEWVDEREKKRIGRLEMLDEVEELNLLAKHYCVAWGFREGKLAQGAESKADEKVESQGEEEETSSWDRWKALPGTIEALPVPGVSTVATVLSATGLGKVWDWVRATYDAG